MSSAIIGRGALLRLAGLGNVASPELPTPANVFGFGP